MRRSPRRRGASTLLLGGLFAGSVYLLGKLVEDVLDRHHGGDRDGDLDYDDRAMGRIRRERSRPVRRVAQGLSLAGRGATVTATSLLGAAELWRERPRSALFLVASTLGALALERAAKAALRRPRPAEGRRPKESSSFPSGHTTVSTAAALAGVLIIRRDFPRRRLPFAAVALPFAAAVGISRPLLERHFPSDVLAGHTLGAAWTLALHAWYGRNGTDVAWP